MGLLISNKLNNSKELIKIEEHFKLIAGPGAGKTTFLINHIKNILANSKRLSKVKKIACITYTNTGVETILSRLEDSLDNVEVSTIHSFLYKNVIKPYLWVLGDEFKFGYENINGHDEIIPTHSLLERWIKETKQNYLFGKDKELIKALSNLRWEMNNEEFKIVFSKANCNRAGDYRIKSSSLFDYKKICWENGLISHDDVLYLSYRILDKEEGVLKILRAKFPYLIIDEFQDTNPIQTYMISKLAEKEMIVGVIGDEWQSIYEFQGAKVEEFENFNLDGIKLYKLENNHRSTQEIIDVLNDIRNDEDFKQVSCENKSGDKPMILVGNFFKAYKRAANICENENIYILTRTNSMANKFKYNLNDDFGKFDFEKSPEELLLNLRTFDGERGKLILNIIYGIEYCKQGKLKEAIKYIKKAYRKLEEFDNRDALRILYNLTSKYDDFIELNIEEFYMRHVYNFYKNVSKISKGKTKDIYSILTYKKVAVAIKLNDESSFSKTIHKSKGDEFENVLVVIDEKERDLDFLLNPNKNKEDNRIYYVAFSRAKKRLFINIPKLNSDLYEKLDKFKIEYLDL
ncbi:ATP-dependent helicase [Clostridium perfringens]|uniref:ATP-dependent helicase n=1 Tax=Clostridium perfringens TaxID=1502 RepID=UPI001A258179|nr:ATP-dependent helicase [Clostridium perfringens]MDH2474387.1 ATP-dependent helicase [Clostridium perfringens]MDK0933575.1 ATP-dependent helicase [Clostridium perfringens]MDM0964592.1 ATP-dependent helicase [Clostridium perfringens]HAT4182966.1 ATP-dependent helicase [Clostridium perfringens]